MTRPSPSAHSRPLEGILWMLVTGLSFVGVNVIVKHLGTSIPSAQSAFLRFVLGLLFLLPVLRTLAGTRLSVLQWRLVGLRGAIHTVGVLCWFYAMTRIPLAEVTAMNFLNPIYVTLGAALFLGEALALRRLAAIGAALLGALIILRPGFRELDPGHVAMLVTALAFGASYLIAKRLSTELPATVVVAILSVTVALGLAPFAWAVWVPPSWTDLGWLTVVAGFATAGHYTMTRAFAVAPAAVTQPVTFLQLVWAVLLGTLLFDEAADAWVIVGGAVIAGAVSYIAWREANVKLRQITPPTEATKL